MPDFYLTPDQIGELAEDGSIIKHPALDVFGTKVDMLNPTRKPVGKRQFVCIPTGRDHEDNKYILPAPAAKPVNPLAEALKKANPDAD